MKCWICNAPADTAEHRIKKSDLTALHGKGHYKNGGSLVMIKDGKEIPIQGPNSKHLQYNKTLCRKCNGAKTQDFDFSYSDFTNYLLEQQELILHKRFIDFRDVYGENFESGQRNLYKYFVKSFCCRLVNAGRNVPKHLVKLLEKDRFLTKLRITFAINEDKVLLLKDKVEIVGNGELWILSNSTIADNCSYSFSEYLSYLHIFHWYNCTTDGRLGSPWTADSQFIYLGSFSPLSAEQRKEMIEKINKEK